MNKDYIWQSIGFKQNLMMEVKFEENTLYRYTLNHFFFFVFNHCTLMASPSASYLVWYNRIRQSHAAGSIRLGL